MSYQTDLQAILNRYPEIKSIKVVKEENIERGVMGENLIVTGDLYKTATAIVKPTTKTTVDLFIPEGQVKPFPSIEKKSPTHLDDKSAKALAATMAELTKVPQLD